MSKEPGGKSKPKLAKPWYSISEKPKQTGMYLVFMPDADPKKSLRYMAWYSEKIGWGFLPKAWIEKLTHWAEFPDAP